MNEFWVIVVSGIFALIFITAVFTTVIAYIIQRKKKTNGGNNDN